MNETVSAAVVAPVRETVKVPASGPVSAAASSVAAMETTGVFISAIVTVPVADAPTV